jgi:hypothetical protein
VLQILAVYLILFARSGAVHIAKTSCFLGTNTETGTDIDNDMDMDNGRGMDNDTDNDTDTGTNNDMDMDNDTDADTGMDTDNFPVASINWFLAPSKWCYISLATRIGAANFQHQ